MNVCIFIADSNGGFPVPAVKDGAVQILIEHLIEQNSEKKECNLVVVSLYDENAEQVSKKYKNVEFIWIKPPKIIKKLDNILFNIIKNIFHSRKAMSYRTMFSLLYYIRKSSNMLKKSRYDKVVFENNIPLASIIKISKYKGEYYYHLHNVPRINFNCKKVFENCTGYLCVSNYVGNEIAKPENPIGPIDHNKIFTLYNCIDTKKFCVKKDRDFSHEIREKYKINDEEKILIFVGRLSEEKGIDKVIEALNLISNEKFKFLVVGATMHSSDLKDGFQIKLNSIINEKIRDKIIFTGYIEQKDLPKYYNVADIAIMPSMWEEPAGLTMVEALCCGAALITTRSGGIPEYVSDYAIVLDKDDKLIENMATEIKSLINNGNKVGNDKLMKICDKYTTDGYMKRFIDILNMSVDSGKDR